MLLGGQHPRIEERQEQNSAVERACGHAGYRRLLYQGRPAQCPA